MAGSLSARVRFLLYFDEVTTRWATVAFTPGDGPALLAYHEPCNPLPALVAGLQLDKLRPYQIKIKYF